MVKVAREPRVFMVEPPRADISVDGARRFGEVCFLFAHRNAGTIEQRRNARPRPSTNNLNEFGRLALEALKSYEYDSDVDYFLITGGILQVSTTFAAVGAEYGRFKALVFNASEDVYAVKQVDTAAMKGDTACLNHDTDVRSPTRASSSSR